ncbi:unnamed protein product [Fraxinus pennsylvanica]|uniref:Uncharacterized protein n=1 Tax=Fraxinus pennsylvanica TaxID=56036 RepID=A0AAD1YTH7_9LAMI|nr:unnamed protein product [Fraxinus pennsylvanica]
MVPKIWCCGEANQRPGLWCRRDQTKDLESSFPSKPHDASSVDVLVLGIGADGFDDLYLGVVSPPFQSFDDEFWKLNNDKSQDSELIEPKKKREYVFPQGSILGPSTVDSKEIQLVQNLPSSAEKVGEKQCDRVMKRVRECDRTSSSEGTHVQRLVFYFREAFYEKIDRETGRITPKGLGKKSEDPLEALKCQD